MQVRTLLEAMHRVGCAVGDSVAITCGDFNSCAGSPLHKCAPKRLIHTPWNLAVYSTVLHAASTAGILCRVFYPIVPFPL